MNDIYLHTSDLSKARSFRDDRQFEIPVEYSVEELKNLHQNEYGRLKTRENYYHIILGSINQKDCPWCSSICQTKKLGENKILKYSQYVIQCVKCFAQGPLLNVSFSSEQNLDEMQHINDMMMQRFEQRRQWDDNLFDPYASRK